MDERIWTDTAPAMGDVISRTDVTVTRRFDPPAAYLVSGDIDAAMQTLCPGAPMLGLLEDSASASSYGIRIGRSTLLLVMEKPLENAVGWQAAGCGVSDASDAYAAFDVSGKGASELLAEGGVVVHAGPSPSASISFAGIPSLITKHGAIIRVWVTRASQCHVATFFKG